MKKDDLDPNIRIQIYNDLLDKAVRKFGIQKKKNCTRKTYDIEVAAFCYLCGISNGEISKILAKSLIEVKSIMSEITFKQYVNQVVKNLNVNELYNDELRLTALAAIKALNNIIIDEDSHDSDKIKAASVVLEIYSGKENYEEKADYLSIAEMKENAINEMKELIRENPNLRNELLN